MAEKYWLGSATAVAQVSTGTIDTVDGTPANNTFTVTIGGVSVSVVGNTNANTTATNLRAALNASTHPYFSTITWSGATNAIIGTADVAGIPFIAVLSVSGAGTGTVTDFAATVASAGPNDWSTASNWSTGVVPADTDDVIIRDTAVSIFWGLDQNAVDLDSLTIERTFTGKIGLRRSQFSTNVDENVSTAIEYRQHYLKIGGEAVNIGQNFGTTTPDGSGRIKIHNVLAAASRTEVFGTGNSSTETNLPSVRLLFDDTAAELFVRNATTGVGVAVDAPFETSNLALVSVNDLTGGARVTIGAGVTLTDFEQFGGNTVLSCAATVTSLYLSGGNLRTEGDYDITAAVIEGGTWTSNSFLVSSGVVADLITMNGGTADFTASSIARTLTELRMNPGATLVADSGVITITDFVEPTTGRYRLQTS